MEKFKIYLQQEFVKRANKNPSYSLRAFAKQLDINHATLSSLLSGKRKITQATVQRLARALDLGPTELTKFLEKSIKTPKSEKYFLIQQDAFAAMSEWYFDAILETTLIPKFKFNPQEIAKTFGITALQAKIAIETLVRLELLYTDKKGKYKIRHKDTMNLLDSDFTSVVNRKYQKSVLEKSVQALEKVNRKNRDHTSTTMAIDKNDLPKVKELIQKFRHDLNAYLQRSEVMPNEVFQLQISFFPLNQNLENNKEHS